MKKTLQFVREAKEELRRVTWPDRDEVTNFTIVVMVTVFVTALFLWLVDEGIVAIIKMAMR